MIKRIINLRSNTITFSAGLIAFSVGVSALLGLLRDGLLASNFLVGETDVYFVAFRVPDFIYGILITGGIVAAFLPVFSGVFKKDNKEAWKLANNTLNILLILLILICLILLIFTPAILKVIAPGFSPEQIEQTISLTRIMLLSPILLGISGLFSGILQYFDRFLAYSLSPILYNVGIIFGIIFFTPYFGIMGVAYGVVLGSFLHLLIQVVPAYMSGFSYKPVIDFSQKEIRRIFHLMVPRIIGQGSTKINIIVITALASLLAEGSISVFNYANHLQSFPVRAIGVSFAVAAFPVFSRSIAMKDKEVFFMKLSSVVRQVLFLIIPATVIIFLLRAYIVRMILGINGLGWTETQLTAASLGIFTFSFLAATLVHILVRVFFSFQDTKTPVIASIFSMAVNIGLSVFFLWALSFENFFRSTISSALRLEGIGSIEVIAFPLAIFFSSALHLFLLTYFLRGRLGELKGFGIKTCFQKTLLSSAFMGLTVFLSLRIMGSMFALDTFFSVFIQSSLAFLFGIGVYILVSKVVKTAELFEIKQAFKGGGH